MPWLVRYLLGKAAIGGVNVVIDRHYEYAFAVDCLATLNMRDKDILEIGCCGSFLPMIMAAMGNRVVGVDLYPWDVKYPGLKMTCGNILEVSFPFQFDLAVSISVIEHMGLTRYGKPGADLDHLAVARIRSMLRAEGHFVISVPYGTDRTFPRYHRVYDAQTFSRLTEGFGVVRQEFFAPIGSNQNLEPCNEADTHRFGQRPLPYAITCALLRRVPSNERT